MGNVKETSPHKMAKSKAQRMKEYRERKKQQLGSQWLEMERERTKPYFRKMEDLDNRSQAKRRGQNRESQKRYRKRVKEETNANNGGNEIEVHIEDQQPSTSHSNDENAVSSTSDSIMTVKLPFPTTERRHSSGRKRVSRALYRSRRTVEGLEDQNEELKRKLKSAQRRLQRHDAKKEATCTTPKSKADRLLKNSGIKPNQVPIIRKQLIYGECLSEEIKTAKAAQGKVHDKLQIVHRVVSGRIMKKYRLRSTMEKKTNLNRRSALRSKSVSTVKMPRHTEKKMNMTREIVEFLQRDDNSRMLPGKADAVKTGKEITQKRVMNDYIYNLHAKFLAESTFNISRASFYRCRPKYMSLVNFASRSVCLCSGHQNFCFILRSLKTMNISTCANPEKFVEMYKDSPDLLHELLEKIPTNESNVNFQQWKKVTLKNGKERQRVVEVETPRKEFIEMMMKTFTEFASHVHRVKDQYAAIKLMKDKLPGNQVLIQMDFSENYACKTLEEIQSAYWNTCTVTMHPVVIYYGSNGGQMTHSSHVYVSDVLSHNAAMVISIIDKIMSVVKKLVPDLTCVHFWTDSPSSQYRNKTIFDLVCHFQKRYAVLATWHYFECGHGKGPCDGVGGTTKRNADNAVKKGTFLIQDATDFFAWAKQHERGIQYEFVSEDEYASTKASVDQRNTEIKPLKGSMLLHAVVGIADGRIIIRNTSCVCNECFRDGTFHVSSSCGWEESTIVEKSSGELKKKTVVEEITEEVGRQIVDYNESESNDKAASCEDCDAARNENVTENDTIDVMSSINRFVVARYDGTCYIGTICKVDHTDNTVYVKFMTKCGKYAGQFKWPNKEDTLWMAPDDILRLIADPTQTGKTGRIYTVKDDVLNLLRE